MGNLHIPCQIITGKDHYLDYGSTLPSKGIFHTTSSFENEDLDLPKLNSQHRCHFHLLGLNVAS